MAWAMVDRPGFWDYYISVRYMTARVIMSRINTQFASRCLRK